MDPISIITLCASATISAYNVSQTLYSIVHSTRNIDSEVEALAAEVTSVRRVLDAIGVIFVNPLIKSEKAMSAENAPIWAAVAGALNDCRVSIERFDMQLSGRTRKLAGSSLLKQSLKWMKLSFKLDDIAKLRFQMNTHANNLQISLQMVSILVSSIGPQQKAVTVIGNEYSQLEKSMSELTLVEANLTPAERQEHQRQTQYLRKTANAVLSSLDGSSLVLDQKDEQDSRRLLSSVVADFNRSVYDQADRAYNLMGDVSDDEEDHEKEHDKLELDLAYGSFEKAEVHFGQKRWRLAETVLREGFQHIESIGNGGEGLDIVRAQLLLIQCCMRQDKWSEAELMLMLLVKPSPGTKITLSTLQAYQLLSQVHLCQYDFNNALGYCREALKGRQRLLGKTHELTASTLQLLALIHEANGDAVSADAYQRLILATAQDLTENEIVNSRFQGYSTVDHLRTSLDEKASAIRELMKHDFIDQTQKHAAEGDHAPNSMSPTIKFDPSSVDVEYGKALRWAVGTDHELVVRWLLSRGADPDTDLRGTPALVCAAHGGHTEVVATLLASGAAINATDNSGRTAVLWASLWGYNASVRVLLDHGADADKPDNDGATPLMDAAVKGHESTVRMLLEHGVNAESRTKRGRNALLLAADNGRLEACRILVQYGVNLDARNAEGQTALIIGAERREESMIRLLAEAGADVNAKDREGKTALRKLAPTGRLSSMRHLIEKHAAVDTVANDGSTALYECADSGYSDAAALLTLLLEHGADPRRECHGRNALEAARMRNNEACVAVLEKHFAQNYAAYEKT